MSGECVGAEQIAEVLARPASDPARQHVERCPRCSTLAATYRAFLEADAPVGADAEDADVRLLRFLERRAGLAADRGGADTAGDRNRGGGPSAFLARVAGAVRQRPAWAAAALVAVVAAGVLVWRPWLGGPPERPLVRGTRSSGAIEVAQSSVAGGTAVQLGWRAVGGADGYRVVVYNEGLQEIARFEVGGATSWTVARSDLPPGAPSELLCRVVAFQDGDEVAASAPFPIGLP